MYVVTIYKGHDKKAESLNENFFTFLLNRRDLWLDLRSFVLGDGSSDDRTGDATSSAECCLKSKINKSLKMA